MPNTNTSSDSHATAMVYEPLPDQPLESHSGTLPIPPPPSTLNESWDMHLERRKGSKELINVNFMMH